MCQTTRSRVCSVSCPSQSASNSPSTGQASRPVSAMCSAPRASSSRPRAREARSCARLCDTPSTMARSLSLRSCLKLSSMTSRSRGFSPARMEWIRLRSSACPWSPLTWPGPWVGWPITRNGVIGSASWLITWNCTVASDSSPHQQPADRPELHRHIRQSRPRRPAADRPELHRRIRQLISRIGQRADRPELHRRIRQVIGRSSQRADRPELHRRIRQVIGRIGQRADRPELHRRIRQVITRIGQLIGRIGRLVGRIGLLIADRRRGPDSASTFVPGQCEQPRTQLGGLGQVAERCSGDDECVLQGPGRGRRVVKDPMGVAVQGRRVPVVCHGDARRVSRRDRRDNLAVVLAVFAWRFRRPAGG